MRRTRFPTGILVILLVSLQGHALAQRAGHEVERPRLPGRDGETLARDLARLEDDLVRRAGAGISDDLPPATVVAHRCDRLTSIVDQQRAALAARYYEDAERRIGAAFAAGIESAPLDDAARRRQATLQQSGASWQDDAELDALKQELRESVHARLDYPGLAANAGHAVELALHELALTGARRRLGCGAQIAPQTRAQQLRLAAAADATARLRFWREAKTLLVDSDDPATRRMQIMSLFDESARAVALLAQSGGTGSSTWNAAVAALVDMAAGSRTLGSGATMTNNMTALPPQDVRFVALADALYRRLPANASTDAEILAGIGEETLRRRGDGAARELATFTDRAGIEGLMEWAARTADDMLNSPATLERALANIRGE